MRRGSGTHWSEEIMVEAVATRAGRLRLQRGVLAPMASDAGFDRRDQQRADGRRLSGGMAFLAIHRDMPAVIEPRERKKSRSQNHWRDDAGSQRPRRPGAAGNRLRDLERPLRAGSEMAIAAAPLLVEDDRPQRRLCFGGDPGL